MENDGLTHVAIVGGGLIGASWAALCCCVGGQKVSVWEPDSDARKLFSTRFEEAREQLAKLGSIESGEVSMAASLREAVSGAGWVQENIPEKLEAKKALYAELEQFVEPSTVIASSTSAFRWSDLALDLQHPERFITAHPFNPPHLIPLVEIYGIDTDVVARASRFYRTLGRRPVVLRKDAIGHIANRLSSALWREAVSIVADGIASVEDVDAALVHGPGLRWAVTGSHLIYHLGGGEGGLEKYLREMGPSQEQRWRKSRLAAAVPGRLPRFDLGRKRDGRNAIDSRVGGRT